MGGNSVRIGLLPDAELDRDLERTGVAPMLSELDEEFRSGDAVGAGFLRLLLTLVLELDCESWG